MLRKAIAILVIWGFLGLLFFLAFNTSDNLLASIIGGISMIGGVPLAIIGTGVVITGK